MECVICLDPLIKSGEELVTVLCGHLFHNSCLVKTLATAPTCPICRKVAFKEHIIKIFINNDGALGECQDCTKKKKELEECLELTNKMVTDQSKLFDSEQHALNRARHFEDLHKEAVEKLDDLSKDLEAQRTKYSELLEREQNAKERARHLETRNEELIKENEELKKEKAILLDVHSKETKVWTAKVECLRRNNNKLKEENRFLMIMQQQEMKVALEREQRFQRILDEHHDAMKVLNDQVEILGGRNKKLTEEQQAHSDDQKKEKECLTAQMEALREELKKESEMRKDLEVECNDLRLLGEPGHEGMIARQKVIDKMLTLTPTKPKPQEIMEEIPARRRADQKPKRGRRDEKDQNFSIEMVSLIKFDSDSDGKDISPIKRLGRKSTALNSDNECDSDDEQPSPARLV